MIPHKCYVYAEQMQFKTTKISNNDIKIFNLFVIHDN